VPDPVRQPFRRVRALTVVVASCTLLVTSCAPPAEPVAVGSRRTSEAPPSPGTEPSSAPSSTLPPSTLPPSSTGPQATTSTSTSTAPGGLSRSTSVGDRRYPRLGSADIDVDHYDVALTYDNAAVSLSGRITVSGRFVNATDQIALDTAGPHVTDVTGDDGPLHFTQADDELVVALGTPEPSGATFTISVDFSSEVPRSGDFLQRAGLFINEDGSGVWSVNEPDGTSTWLPVNDHPTD
jgi:hypothetical protein